VEIHYQPIGVIHSPFTEIGGMPIQPAGAEGVKGSVDVYSQFKMGLQDLQGFSHIYLLYHFHRVTESQLMVIPFMDDQPRGLFATRAPKRPNPIGLSVVRLVGIEDNVLHVENLDVLDGTPLLDIKPYVPAFDHFEVQQAGWLEEAGNRVQRRLSDDRFE
jgi:tRNA-Thr(GGU) m(6)t(6)A37 methyltransferase TsaA